MTRNDSETREVDRLRTRLAMMSEVSRRITQSLNLNTVLQGVVDGACQLADARYGAVGVLDDSGRIREFITSGITPEQRRVLGEPPKGLGVLGYLNEVQKPVRLADLTEHSHSFGFPKNHPLMKTFLGVPIRHLGEPVGNIYLTEKEGAEEFSEEDEEPFLVVCAMEDVLEVYQRHYAENEVLVCMDETSKQQVKETRVPRPAARGVVSAYDYAYERNGVSSLFMLFAPLDG